MINKRELSVGSYVEVQLSYGWLICQVVEILRDDKVGAAVLYQSNSKGEYMIGKIEVFPLSSLNGIRCTWTPLRDFGFTDSDERGWKLVYWFGLDMKLLYRYDNKKMAGSFRFKSNFRKSYVHISCRYVHELQNIMRFLTGGELEFEYHSPKCIK